jgi:peptidoglycan/LPS O-acetylase OafA/YrhL
MRQVSNWLGFRLLTNGMFLEFGAGVGLAMLLPELRRVPLKLGAATLALALAGFGFAMMTSFDVRDIGGLFEDRSAYIRVLYFGVPAAILVMGALIVDRAIVGRATTNLLARLGDASYSIYLAHPLVLLGVYNLSRVSGLPRAVAVVAGMIMSAAAGVAIYRWIERPLLRWCRRLGEPSVQLGAVEQPVVGVAQ